jgi:preprotein translocase subunit SecE
MARTRTGPFDFLSQVRTEGEKVTWPSRKETLITAAMVFVMAIAASVFFLITDVVLQKAVGLVLGLGG